MFTLIKINRPITISCSRHVNQIEVEGSGRNRIRSEIADAHTPTLDEGMSNLTCHGYHLIVITAYDTAA